MSNIGLTTEPKQFEPKFGNLTNAQRERFEMLAEEAAEVIQVCTKILRHGRDSYHPEDLDKTPNVVLLGKELMDLWAVYERMCYHGDISQLDFNNIEEVWMKKRRYTRHQPDSRPVNHPPRKP